MKIDIKKSFKLILFLLIPGALAAGISAGIMIGGSCASERMYSGTPSLFFYRPASDYIFQYRMINSPDPLERLAAYYSIVPSGPGDIDFLIKRFNDEPYDPHKRVIVWRLGFSEDRKRAAAFLKDIYPDQNKKIRLEIKSSLERLGFEYDKSEETEEWGYDNAGPQ